MRRNAIDLFTFVGQFIAQATTALRSEIYLAFMVAVANRRGQRGWAAPPGAVGDGAQNCLVKNIF